MGTRNFVKPRCAGCGLHDELCICEEMPRLDLKTRILVVQNNHEKEKPTNTGRLVNFALNNSELVRYAVRGVDFDPAPLQVEGVDYRVLFPRPENTTPCKEWRTNEDNRPRTLVVLDGTWAQCSRMSHRVPGVADMPSVSFDDLSPSRWGVRTTTDPTRMSTFEATLRALAEIEGNETVDPLRQWFLKLAARMLYMKAKLRKPEIPAEWLT